MDINDTDRQLPLFAPSEKPHQSELMLAIKLRVKRSTAFKEFQRLGRLLRALDQKPSKRRRM